MNNDDDDDGEEPKLMRCIDFLGRIKSAYDTFLLCTRFLARFKEMEIRPVRMAGVSHRLNPLPTFYDSLRAAGISDDVESLSQALNVKCGRDIKAMEKNSYK